MRGPITPYYNKLFVGSERTIVIKKNIMGSAVVKGLSMLVSLSLVPYTIHLLDQEKYGIWITLFSIVTWFNMLDIGLGNGFRNKFAEAVAIGNNVLAKKYVDTLYSSMAIIAVAFLIITTLINPFLNWNKILNVSISFDENLAIIAWLVFALFCLQLYFKNISTILLSLQRTTYSNMVIFLGNIGSLLLIFIFQKLHFISLFSIALAFMSAPVLIFTITSLILFNSDLKEFKPNLFTLPKKEYFNNLIGLGLKFFFIQITAVVIYASSNVIISLLFGPSEVTPYNVAFRLYSTIQAVFSIIITPFWSAFTEANAKEDFDWIKKSIKKLVFIWGLFAIGTFILWVISPFVFQIWVGKGVVVPVELSLQFAIFVIVNCWISIFSSYLAGISKIAISLYIAIFQLITYIPFAIYLAGIGNLNTTGIILATNVSLMVPAILLALQAKRIVNKQAYGIWNR